MNILGKAQCGDTAGNRVRPCSMFSTVPMFTTQVPSPTPGLLVKSRVSAALKYRTSMLLAPVEAFRLQQAQLSERRIFLEGVSTIGGLMGTSVGGECSYMRLRLGLGLKSGLTRTNQISNNQTTYLPT